MRKVYKNYGMYKKWSKALQKHILKTHADENIKKQMQDSIMLDKAIETPPVNSSEMDIITI